VGDIVNVCGHCHQNTGEAFRRSPHAATDDMRCAACHAEKADQAGFQRSGCAACHGAHDIAPPGEAMYTGDAVGHCGHCHRQEGEALALGREIVEGKQQLRDAMGETLREIQAAKQEGLFLENEALHLRETERTLVSVRPLAHSMDGQAIEAHIADGLERQQMTQDEIAKQHRVLRDRKILTAGLAGALLMMAGLLGVKLGAVRRLS
jgi:hypothetical protein